jgi:hypothetical protein
MTAAEFDSRNWADIANGAVAPVTVRMVLFGEDPRAAVPKGGWPVLRARLSRVRSDLRPTAERELAAAVAGLFDVDLADAVREAWRTHARLVAAARATVDNPGATEMVALAEHRITASHTPHVDLIIDDVKVATIEVTIEIVIDAQGIVATVHAGRLVALHNGRCQACVTLTFAGEQLLSGTAILDAPSTVSLGAGIDLLNLDAAAPRLARTAEA